MRIDVVGRHFQMTDAISAYAEKKAEKLSKFSDQIQLITIRVNGEDHHHTNEFGLEIVVEVEHREDFIAEAREHDVYHAIDAAMHKMVRLLTDYKERLKGHGT